MNHGYGMILGTLLSEGFTCRPRASAGKLTGLNGKAIFILVLQDVVVLGALRLKNDKNDSERTEHRERCQ